MVRVVNMAEREAKVDRTQAQDHNPPKTCTKKIAFSKCRYLIICRQKMQKRNLKTDI